MHETKHRNHQGNDKKGNFAKPMLSFSTRSKAN